MAVAAIHMSRPAMKLRRYPRWMALMASALQCPLFGGTRLRGSEGEAMDTRTPSEIDDTQDAEPGTKFEAFTYVDPLPAIDFRRHLGRARPDQVVL